MSQTQCTACGHGNPADARFCSACGGALRLLPHLVSCLRCGSINPVTADTCVWCHAKIPNRLWRQLRRRNTRVVVATAAVAVMAILGYYTFAGRPLPDAPVSAAGAAPAAVLPPPEQGNPLPAAGAAKAEVALTRPPLAGAKTAERTAARPAACSEASAALGLCGQGGTERRDTPELPRSQPCTEGLAALGLCQQTVQRGE